MTSNYTTKLYSNQNSMGLAQNRYIYQWWIKSPDINPGSYGQLIYDKGGKTIQYNGEKTVSSISGAGKTGQLHVKEWN